jgi:hypothetical protein
MNEELLFFLVGFISKKLDSNLDDLLIESIREYSFSKEDCLEILYEFDQRYNGYSQMIERIEKVIE